MDRGPGRGVGVRAVLFVRAIVADDAASDAARTFFIVEIERRLTPEGDAEKLRDLIFELAPDGVPAKEFGDWFDRLRDDLVRSRGVFRPSGASCARLVRAGP